jgi:CRISPR-associated protein Cas2
MPRRRENRAEVVLSAYRLMWMMVLFDLPVMTKRERKAATDFRKFLLDQGFEMAQYSVYMRFCAGKEQADTYTRRVERKVPSTGKVHIMFFTDRQYETIISFDGRLKEGPRKNPTQYVLF